MAPRKEKAPSPSSKPAKSGGGKKKKKIMANPVSDPRHNVVAYLGPTKGYEDVIRWLKRSNISHAITCDIHVFEDQIRQFWETAEFIVDTNPNHIKATVNDRIIRITEETVRKVLQLRDSANDPHKVDGGTVIEGFLKMGYEGDFVKKEIKKALLSREWRFITHVFCVCLSHRKGGFDAINMTWAGAMLRLCRGQPVNISHIIFSCMSGNAQSEKWLMYPRFVQMMLNNEWKDLPTDGDEFEFTRMQSRIFADSNRPPPTFSGRWTPLFDNMYPAERLPAIKKLVERLKRERNSKEQQNQENAEAERLRKGKGKHVAESSQRDACDGARSEAVPTKRRHDRDTAPEPLVVTQEEDVEDALISLPHVVRAMSPSPAPSASGSQAQTHTSQQREDVESEKPPKKAKHSHGELNEEIVNKIGQAAAKEMLWLKGQIKALIYREEHREKDISKLEAKIKNQKSIIKNQKKAILLQQNAIEKMFGMISDLQKRLDIESTLTFDDLFNFNEDAPSPGTKEAGGEKEDDTIPLDEEEEEEDEEDMFDDP